MGLLRMALVVLGATLLLFVGLRAWMWTRVRDRRLGAPRIRPTAGDQLPAALEPLFEAAGRELEALGFSSLGARWIDSIDVYEGPRPERVYRHDENGALAFVGPPLPGMGERPYRVSFISPLAGGPVVATFDGLAHLTAGFPPGWRCADRDLNDLGRQWELHVASLASLASLGEPEPAPSLPLEEWNGIERRALADTLRDWEARALTCRAAARRGGAPRWRFRPLAAWSLACRALAGQRRVLAREADAMKHRARQQLWRSNLEPLTDATTPNLEAARAAAMAWGYEYLRDAGRRRAQRRTARRKVVLALASGALSLVAFGAWLGWALASALMCVLLVHELGHLIGMKAFGYRDRRLVFVPFVGTATCGTDPEITPGRRALVHLLGPIPGLLLGLAALYVFARGADAWWLLAGLTALMVNYFNLLPIPPLDGGRMVESLLLARFPRAQVAFLAVGVAVLAAAAWAFHDLVLAGLALALAASLRFARIASGALRRARDSVSPRMDESDRVRAVFQTLQEPPFADLPAARRQRIAELIVPPLTGSRVSLRAALAGAVVYVGLLVGVPVAVSAGLSVYRPAVWGAIVETVWGGGEAYVTEAPPPAPDAGAIGEQGEDQPSAARISEASLVGR